MTQPDGNVSRCVSCGVWTENHLVCGVCEVPLHPRLCPWTLRGFPACHCTEAEAQLAAYGYFRGKQDGYFRGKQDGHARS